MLKKPVLRVKQLSLRRFRGFVNCEPIILDTNADVILLTGPNGFGKTSVIDALCLLLTGHYYPERLPLTSCTKPPDSSCPDSAEIQALVECEGSEEDRIVITIRDGQRGEPDISPRVGLFSNQIPPELAARSSFFYQDLLSKLFEEEDAQAGRLLEFLGPLPKAVSVVEDAIKKARTQWKDQISEELSRLASVEGFPNEDAINEDRKQAASVFKTCWYELVRAAEAEGSFNLPQRSEGWLLLLKSDNLRAGWERELRNLAADCLSLFFPNRPEPAANEKPSVSLGLIEETLNVLRDTILDNTEKAKERLYYTVGNLPDDTVLLPLEAWAGEEQQIAAASEEANKLREQLSLLERLERHFDNPSGPNLLEVVAALRDQGRAWLNLPEAGPDLSPPPQVLEWLQAVVAHDLPALTGQLEAWKGRITNGRLDVSKRVLELQKFIQDKKTLLDKSRKIYDLFQNPQIKRDFGDVLEVLSWPVQVSMLKTLLGQIKAPDNLTTAIERVREAIAKWKQIEELDERKKTALQQKAGYEKAKELIDSIGKALEQETGKNSVLKAALLPPDEIIKDLERVINEILDRFRLVNGISPMRFETKRGRSVKSAQSLCVYTADSRPLNALSTGQKAQLGLSTLLGLNYALNRYIRHSVIALDDVTTAFDMAQLPRTAALIRQIAYVTAEPLAHRQVFIVSHHEELTNRLLDFLIPPEGRELRILNFVDWSISKGPSIEQREVIPGLQASQESRKKFADTLKSILNTND